MQCYFLILLLLVSVGGVYGSIVELNDTLREWFPKLYALDDWAACQRPMDKYCLVDAVLRSRGPSPLLDALKEYSSQTLKHYNRTQVHRGVCISRCQGNISDLLEAAQNCVNQSVQRYELEAEVFSAKWCSTPGSKQASGAARAMGVIVIAIIIITVIATAVSVISDKMGNRFLMAFSLKNSWKILTYDRSNPRQEPRMKDLSCLEGVRVIGIECVIFAHVLLNYLFSYIDNPEFFEKMYDQLGWKIMLNSPLWLQAFFTISAFINTYTWLISTEKRDITIGASLLAIVNRWVRLTPILVFSLWFTMAWNPLLGSGPQWSWVVERESQECSDRWISHILFYSNLLPMGKFCMGHLWYLSVDMQLHVFGTLLMYLLLRCRRAVAPVLLTVIISSAVAAGCVVYFYELTPLITMQPPEAFRTIFLDNEIVPRLYLPAWMNVSGFACGIAVAFIHYNNQQNGIKLNEKKWFNILNQLSLHLGSIVAVLGVFFLADTTPPIWASALYSALDRTLISLIFSIFLLGLVSGCKSPILTVFSWRGFHVMGKLSYCVYTLHFTVLRFTVAYNTQLGHVTIFSVINLLIIGTVVTYIVSIPVCLFIEIPFTQLWKAISQRPVPQQATEEPANPKFDLVTSIHGQNEV